MAVIIPNDPTWGFLTFGDSAGTVGDRAVEAGQTLHDVDANVSTNRVATQVGDARLLTDRAHGGNDDLLIVNRQNAHIFGDAFDMSGRAHGGNDLISATGEFTADAYGDARTMTGRAVGGNDTITVAAADSAAAFGDAQSMSDRARGGDDHLNSTGGGVRAVLYGDAQFLSGRAHGGDDVLTGHGFTGAGFDGTDMIGDGQVLSDRAHGGNDRLVSGQGVDDNLWGDAVTMTGRAHGGDDTFVFGVNNGNDAIHDFRHGEDHIELHDTVFHSFDDLAGHISASDQGALIRLGTHDSVTVLGVDHLSAADFLFT